jgi:hypothetical protein
MAQRPFMALCVIGGAPPNFRSRRTSRPAETSSGPGELTYSDPSPNLVGASMNGSKRSSAMLQSSATGEPSPPSEQMESVLPRLPLEKQLSIPSCRYGVRADGPRRNRSPMVSLPTYALGPEPHRMLSTVCPRLGGRALVFDPVSALTIQLAKSAIGAHSSGRSNFRFGSIPAVRLRTSE